MTVRRKIVPTSAVELAIAKRASNVSAVVPVSPGAEVFYKEGGAGRAGRGGHIVIRGTHVKPSHRLGTKAKALKDCAGKKGGDFKTCVTGALGKAPRSLARY